MKDRLMFWRRFSLLAGSVLCAAGMWLFVQRILVPYQVVDAAAHGRPRGNLSDLYPRWIGARELLLYGRDPYSPEVTRESQIGYYGRPLDPARPEDPKDQEAFAYPVYVVFYLAPTIHLPFRTVQRIFFWILTALTFASVPLWLRVLRWRAAGWIQAIIMALTFASVVVIQGLKLQQISLLVAAMLAGAVALLAADRPIAAGILLALATIKPQLVLPILLWLGIWSLTDWRRRARWLAPFLVSLAILFAASEWWLPHWLARFWRAIGEYRQYTQGVPMLEALLAHLWGRVVELVFAGAAAFVCWKQRFHAQTTAPFQSCTCLVVALTVLTVPSLYNQVLLLPAILLLVCRRKAIWERNRIQRVLLLISSLLVAWPWLSGTILAALCFLLPPDLIRRTWAVPIWTAPYLPVAVVALMLIHSYRESFPVHASAFPA